MEKEEADAPNELVDSLPESTLYPRGREIHSMRYEIV